MVRKVGTVNTVRQQTFAIAGSVVGTVTASTIAIATLIVLQHDSMRTSSSAEIDCRVRSGHGNGIDNPIATLIVLQHDSMRRPQALKCAKRPKCCSALSAEIGSVRGAVSAEIESVRSAASSEHAALRSDVAEIRDDMRAMHSDISDLRERMARVEVHVGVTAESR